MQLTNIAKTWLNEHVKVGDTVIDATLGNGFDALFLAQSIGKTGTLYGFDVQQEAINNTVLLLNDEPCQQVFFLHGHEHMMTHIPQEKHGHIQGIMFNLGWLPNSDKSVITHADTTILALEQSLQLLAPNGRMSIMLYPGHHGGDAEAAQVTAWLQTKHLHDINFKLEQIRVPQRPKAPILLQIQKENI
jgi:16S rRNA C1402 N4-methylase RsmH